MKSEINNGNRAKFISLYCAYGELYNNESGKIVPISEIILNLKPLSNISDEDLKILQLKKGDYSDYDLWLYQEADYLRSRGYLLGWGGLTEDEIIEAGWAIYTE